jgi:hypothetical protein
MRQKALFAALVFLGFAQASLGTTITTGSFDISGTFYVTLSEATPVITPGGSCPANVSCIFWQDGSGMHNGEVDISTSGLPNGDIPLAIAGNDAANISNLMNPPEVVGSAFSPTAFMTFNNDAVTTELLLNYIFPGIYSSSNCGAAPAVGQDCTPFGSLFNFVNNPPPTGQATASWVFSGVTDTPGVTWTGNFTSQFPANTPFQTVLGELASNGYVDNTFSATITLSAATATPEPSTLALFGGGLLGMAGFIRRKVRL